MQIRKYRTRNLFRQWAGLYLLVFSSFHVLAQSVPGWRLLWSDEFNQPDGSAPSSARWSYDVGGNGWGHDELQYYTKDRRENARVEQDCLVIEARKESYRVGNQTWDYTSSRLRTQGKAYWTYGRFEARIKLPYGQGLWPAFWMLAEDFASVGWPQCGEIDVMENIGKEPSTVHGTAHGPGYSGIDAWTRAYNLSGGRQFHDEFHLFAVEWEPGIIRWSVDNLVYGVLTREGLTGDQVWVFNRPFFLVLNVAVGGGWPGKPNGSTSFPQQMQIDYIRVYTRTQQFPPSVQIQNLGDYVEVSWPTTFPDLRLQYSPTFLPPNWNDFPTQGTMRDGRFVVEAAADLLSGFFRLR